MFGYHLIRNYAYEQYRIRTVPCKCYNCGYYTSRTFERIVDGDDKCNNCCSFGLFPLTVEDIMRELRAAEMEVLVGETNEKT